MRAGLRATGGVEKWLARDGNLMLQKLRNALLVRRLCPSDPFLLPALFSAWCAEQTSSALQLPRPPALLLLVNTLATEPAFHSCPLLCRLAR